MLKSFFASIAVVGLTLATTSQATTASWKATVIKDIDVSPVNGGINPDSFAYHIRATVLAGSNPCEARGVQLAFSQKKKDGTLTLTPVKKVPRGQRICTREFQPVYRSIETTVHGLAIDITDVVIANLGELGNLTSVSEITGAGSEEQTVTGTMTRVMAIGGETTGWALVLESGTQVEVDLATNNLDHDAEAFDGQKLKVTGTYKTLRGVETPSRQVLEASSVEAAD